MIRRIYLKILHPLISGVRAFFAYIIFKVLFFDRISIWYLMHVYPVLFNLFAVMRFVWFAMLMVLVGYFAFTGPDQAQDMLVDLNEAVKSILTFQHNGSLGYLLWMILGLTFWSFICWFSVRITMKTFQIDQITKDNASSVWYTDGIIHHLPRWLGAAPFFIIAFGGLQLNKRDYNTTPLVVTFFILGILCYLFFKFRAPMFNWLADRKVVQRVLGEWADSLRPDPNRFHYGRQDLDKKERVVFSFTLFVSAVLLLIFLIPGFGSRVAILIHPGTIIALALTGWMSFGTVLLRESLRSKIPIFFLFLIYTGGISRCNNDHEVRLAGRLREEDDRQEIRAAFKLWLADVIRSKDFRATDSIPVVVAGAQGGGIRAMNWTASVLEKLASDTGLRDFHRHVFALSGASGGSVGEAVYAAYTHDGLSKNKQLSAMLSGDYLSPVTAGLLYPDMVQKFLPFKCNALDRARRLEDSWAERYLDSYEKSTLDSNFLHLWQDNSKNYVPHLFLNSVLAESGQKAIVSDLKVSEEYFPDAVDVIAEVGYDMPLKTAALTSARFPYITPGGLIHFKNQCASGHLVDGGYLENTGLVTALSVIFCINDFIRDTSDTLLIIDQDTIVLPQHVKERIRPVLMFIQNSDFKYGVPQAASIGHEATIPLKGFINAWDREGVALDKQMRMLCRNLSLKVTYVKFELDRNTEVSLPLGWFLSERASLIIKNQVDRLTQPKSLNYKEYRILRKVFNRTHR